MGSRILSTRCTFSGQYIYTYAISIHQFAPDSGSIYDTFIVRSRYSNALASAVAEVRKEGDHLVTMLTGEEFYEGDKYSIDTDTPSVAGCKDPTNLLPSCCQAVPILSQLDSMVTFLSIRLLVFQSSSGFIALNRWTNSA